MGLESEIRDPEKLIPEPEDKKHWSTHYGSGSTTLIYTILAPLMCVNISEFQLSEQRCVVKRMFSSNEHMTYGNTCRFEDVLCTLVFPVFFLLIQRLFRKSLLFFNPKQRVLPLHCPAQVLYGGEPVLWALVQQQEGPHTTSILVRYLTYLLSPQFGVLTKREVFFTCLFSISVPGLISFLSPEFSVLLCSVFRSRPWFPFCVRVFCTSLFSISVPGLIFLFVSWVFGTSLFLFNTYFGSGSGFLFVSWVFCTSLFSISVPDLGSFYISWVLLVYLVCSLQWPR
jgi:hypothetical protein